MIMMLHRYSARILLLLLQLSSFALADFLFAVGGTVASGTTLYRVDDAGFGGIESVGKVRVTVGGSQFSNFDVVGAVFDSAATRPFGSLFLLTGPNNGVLSNYVLEIPLPYVNLVPGAAFVDAQIYGSVFEPAVGLAITDSQLLLSWRIGEGAFNEDDLISVVPRGGQAFFPQPNLFNLHSGIQSDGRLIGYDVRRDEDQNELVHMIFFDPAASPFHSYFVVNLSQGESGFRSTQVSLADESKCTKGSINPNVDGEFWCIRDTGTVRVSRQTLIRIDLESGTEVGDRVFIDVPDLTAIAFSYDTTQAPSSTPTSVPSSEPSMTPTTMPTSQPSSVPSSIPTQAPSSAPSSVPTESPSSIPSEVPSAKPSRSPSDSPSETPTSMPSSVPSVVPTAAPSSTPSAIPTLSPSAAPSETPTRMPSSAPIGPDSPAPSVSIAPSESPSSIPSEQPSAKPSASPSSSPSETPTRSPSRTPTRLPSATPSAKPSRQPSSRPSAVPSIAPTPTSQNACSTNNCLFLGLFPGATMQANILGMCVERCVADSLEGVYLDNNWSCGSCP